MVYSKKNLTGFSVFLFFVSLPVIGCAQLRIDRVVSPSFNAAALIKYCDHPIGTDYGIPKIKIPLSTIVNHDITIPISLTYHPLGIKVEEEATWTGLGWYLNVGGFITRIVRGENDFGVSEEKSTALGYPFEHIKPCLDDCEKNETEEFHKKVCNSTIDSDPDIFFYDIMGNKGKFLMTPDHDPNKSFIEINIVTPYPMSFKFYIQGNYWVVENETNGFTYTFQAREITYSYDNYFDHKFTSHHVEFLSHYNRATTSWYLTSVVSGEGYQASFIYDVGPAGESSYASNSTYHKMNINDENVWDVHYSSYCFPENIENVQIVSSEQHHDVYLQAIYSGDYSIRFSKSEQKVITPSRFSMDDIDLEHRPVEIPEGHGPQQLDKIEVRKSGDLVSTSSLVYSYFNGEKTGEESFLYQRLKLDRLLTMNEGKENAYNFYYEKGVALPSKESHARDLWGYYNGEEEFYNITPSDFFNYSQPEKLLQEEGKTKHYSLAHLQSGILRKIDYGDRKTESFVYDHQEFETVHQEISDHFTQKMKTSNLSHHIKPFIFGGLRVKEVITKQPSETNIQKFDYTQDGKETGELIITNYNHDHSSYGHKASGNHGVKYKSVKVEQSSR